MSVGLPMEGYLTSKYLGINTNDCSKKLLLMAGNVTVYVGAELYMLYCNCKFHVVPSKFFEMLLTSS